MTTSHVDTFRQKAMRCNIRIKQSVRCKMSLFVPKDQRAESKDGNVAEIGMVMWVECCRAANGRQVRTEGLGAEGVR